MITFYKEQFEGNSRIVLKEPWPLDLQISTVAAELAEEAGHIKWLVEKNTFKLTVDNAEAIYDVDTWDHEHGIIFCSLDHGIVNLEEE